MAKEWSPPEEGEGKKAVVAIASVVALHAIASNLTQSEVDSLSKENDPEARRIIGAAAFLGKKFVELAPDVVQTLMEHKGD